MHISRRERARYAVKIDGRKGDRAWQGSHQCREGRRGCVADGEVGLYARIQLHKGSEVAGYSVSRRVRAAGYYSTAEKPGSARFGGKRDPDEIHRRDPH